MPANPLMFKDAEKARDAITESQQIEIAKLYDDWANEIGEKAKFYSNKTNASAPMSERYYKDLKRQLKATSKEVSNQVYKKTKENIYIVADAVTKNNVSWMKSLGFDGKDVSAAFSSVPDSVVRKLTTGQIYDSGWSLSSRIWGANEETLSNIYGVMAKGRAQNKSIYDITRTLEAYVKPDSAKLWNKLGKDGVKVYKRQVDYNAQRLARTLTQHSYQQSFIETTEKNPLIKSYRWISNGSRACDLCLDRNGKIFKKNALPMDHPNGMCTMEPVIGDVNQELADWFNNPDGTYPELDEFAGNFGYKADKKPITVKPKTKKPLPSKTKMSYPDGYKFNKDQKMFLEKNGYTPTKMPKDFDEWYERIEGTRAEKTIVDKLGISINESGSTRIPKIEEFFNNMIKPKTKAVKSKVKTKVVKDKVEAKAKKKIVKENVDGKIPKVKSFTKQQEKVLGDFGFDIDNMPKSYKDWEHNVCEYSERKQVFDAFDLWVPNVEEDVQAMLRKIYDDVIGQSFVETSGAKIGSAQWIDESLAGYKKAFQLKDDQWEYFTKKLSAADPDYQKLWAKYDDKVKWVKDSDTHKGAHFNPANNRIVMDFDDAIRSAKSYSKDDELATLFHEMGHYFDFNEVKGKRSYLSDGAEFRKAMKKDLEFANKRLDTDQAFKTKLNNFRGDADSSGIQDIIGALKSQRRVAEDVGKKQWNTKTLSNVNTKWGHPISYWEQKGVDTTTPMIHELFAHISSSMVSAKEMDYLSEVFPNCIKIWKKHMYANI